MTLLSRRRFIALSTASAVGALCAGSLSACSTGTGNEKNQRVTIALSPASEPDNGFDPLFGWGCGVAMHDPLIQSTLMTYDDEFNLTYDLATDYTSSDEGLTWTFTLRDDAKFTNGQPVVAADVAFTVEGALQSGSAKVDLSVLDRVEVVDPHTVAFHLTRPSNTLLHSLAFIGIVPYDSYDPDSYGNRPIGSGRYTLAKWERGKRLVLKANPDYYGQSPTMQKIIIHFMREDDACAACYEGKVDLAFAPPRLADQTIDGYSLLDCKTVDCIGVSLPTGAPGGSHANPLGGAAVASGNAITKDLNVRRAINYGIDRKALVKKAVLGYGDAAFGPAEGLPWGATNTRIDIDTAKAAQYLDQSGWRVGADGTRVKNGQRLSLDLYYQLNEYAKVSAEESISAALVTQMAAIGVEIEPHAVGLQALYEHAFSDPVLWRGGNGSPAELRNVFASNGANNFAGYGTEAIDSYLNAGDAATTSDQANELWKKAQWDGTDGPVVQGAATWAWLADIDHIYFKRAILDVRIQHIHTRSSGWSLLNNVDSWIWDS